MTDTIRAISVQTIELPDRTIAPGTEFDCPSVDYDTFIAWGAVKPVAEAKPKRGRKAAVMELATSVPSGGVLAVAAVTEATGDDPVDQEDDIV